jgi:two-component system, sensor histidine kinase and response regulator
LRAQRRRADAEAATEAKSVFLANMSHEMRTPLHVIMGLAHGLRGDLADARQCERIDQLCDTADHLLAIINDVLDLSKIEARRLALECSDFHLDTVVGRVARMVEGKARAKRLVLAIDLAPELSGVAVQGDVLRLAQVLINLADNAVKFTAQGAVRVSIRCLAEDADSLLVAFSVEDSGIGIAPADQPRLFGAFEQADSSVARQHGGTGLGLAISQHLVGLMGGKIEVVSEPGKGSLFSFRLNLPRAAAVAEAAAVLPAGGHFAGRRVLLAEDHPLAREIVAAMLTELGCAVDAVADGNEALAAVQASRYDLVLMDLRMPKLDGVAATRAIRALPAGRDLAIVAMTADAFADDRQHCLDAGMNEHLAKPVTPAMLADALGRWLPADAAEVAEVASFAAVASRSPEQRTEYHALLRDFAAQHGDDMARVQAHLAVGANDAALTVAHKLAGIAGLLGAKRVASLASAIAQGLRASADGAHLHTLADECAAELARFIAEICDVAPPAVDA